MSPRSPRPAPLSRSIPRAEHLAAALALGLILPGCCRSPTEADPALPWWQRLAHRFRCENPASVTPVSNLTPPGAIAMTRPAEPASVDSTPRQPGARAIVTPRPQPCTHQPHPRSDHHRR